ncbi:MAG: tRNA (adenosine(37)-N6)-threonylcarbamoyltransferase complex ATPase subunit type 1 TsaE [Bacteroidetes bacterium]|nr:tRNA (adenosine(37)-N6)-threonylcarbamoyltransferase complex ATPase subunit type 1 TsaE [Bacteroidota bacterium]
MNPFIIGEDPILREEFAEQLLREYSEMRVFAFNGSMGAGKTTLIKAVCKSLGVGDVVTSPTFTLINEYRDRDGAPVYHFDFYRIKKPEEAMDIGYEEYFYSGFYCFLEWPEMIEKLLPKDYVYIGIALDGKDNSRIISHRKISEK